MKRIDSDNTEGLRARRRRAGGDVRPGTTYVAFLRAINVGGHVVTMETLRHEFVALGCVNVETFIASGNVIFKAADQDARALARRIEARLRNSLGYEVKTFLRTAGEVAAVAAQAPFTPARVQSAQAFHVVFLAEPPTPDAVDALMAHRTVVDDFHVRGREVYWLCAVRQSGLYPSL